MKSVLALAAALVVATTGSVFADPRIPTSREWDTDHGHLTMTISPDKQSIVATWQIVDGDTGKLHLTLSNGIYSGYWTADKYFEKCSLSRDFTFYWGNISVIFDSDKGIFAAKDDFCGKHKDKKFEVWKGIETATAAPIPPVTTAPPAINAPANNGPATGGPNVNGPMNKIRPDLLKIGPKN